MLYHNLQAYHTTRVFAYILDPLLSFDGNLLRRHYTAVQLGNNYTATGIITGRMPRSGKLLVLHVNFLTGEKQFFFAQQGRRVVPIHVKLGRADGYVGPLGCAKFHLNRRKGVGMRPQNMKHFHLASAVDVNPTVGCLQRRLLPNVNGANSNGVRNKLVVTRIESRTGFDIDIDID